METLYADLANPVRIHRAGARPGFSAEPKPDWIAFTSSTVKNFVQAAGVEVLRGVRVASIGPVTSATARGHGLDVAAEAQPYTLDRPVAAILGG